MNCALIFAGGTGQRMNTKTRPKQFLELHGKPIIVYTLEIFENHPDIDSIVVVCLESWIPFLEKLLMKFDLNKVVKIVPGGETGQQSIKAGLDAISSLYDEDATVLIHDGVRPLVRDETISKCIDCVNTNGNAITVVPAIETVVQQNDGQIANVIERKDCCNAKAPQCFRLGDIQKAHKMSQDAGLNEFIDSATMMRHFGYELFTVEGEPENIKITTPSDFYIFRAIVDERENSQIFGLS